MPSVVKLNGESYHVKRAPHIDWRDRKYENDPLPSGEPDTGPSRKGAITFILKSKGEVIPAKVSADPKVSVGAWGTQTSETPKTFTRSDGTLVVSRIWWTRPIYQLREVKGELRVYQATQPWYPSSPHERPPDITEKEAREAFDSLDTITRMRYNDGEFASFRKNVARKGLMWCQAKWGLKQEQEKE